MARTKLLSDTMVTSLILVARVSNADQTEALPGQELRLKRYARDIGLPYEYVPFDESAFKGERRKFDALVKRIDRQDQCVRVVFDAVDRFTRNSAQVASARLIEMAQKGRIELYFITQNLTYGANATGYDELMLDMNIMNAKQYSVAVSTNVRRRFESLRRSQSWPHQAPPGYLNKRINEYETTVVVDPDRCHYIVRAFELRTEGLAYDRIANILAEEGFIRRSGRKFTTKDIELIINNKFYYGTMTIKGVDYPHRYEPLITRSLYERAQAVRRRRSHNPSKYNSNEFALKGIATCGRCGHSISPYSQKGYNYLHCAKSKECRQPNASEKTVLEPIRADLAACKIPPEYIAKVIKELKLRHDNQSSYFAATLESNRKQYDRLKARLDVLYEDRLDGRVSAERYDEMAAKIEAQQLELNDEAKNLTKDNVSFLVTESRLLDLCQRAGELFDTSQPALQNELLETVLANSVLEGKKMTYQLKEPFDTVVRINKASANGGSDDNAHVNGWG